MAWYSRARFKYSLKVDVERDVPSGSFQRFGAVLPGHFGLPGGVHSMKFILGISHGRCSVSS
jgi:hypothetical protein